MESINFNVDLASGTKRFGELKKSLGNISQKVVKQLN